MAKKKKTNPFCCVPGCTTNAPHKDDPVVVGLMQLFSPPENLAFWSMAALTDLRSSILADIQEKRHFAWQTRLRQVEEIYFKALYCIFFATAEELPHIFSGVMPNSIMPMYRKVNQVILEGRGQWEVIQPGYSSGSFTPVSILHSSAHASYAAILTAIGISRAPESELNLDGFKQHLDTYCTRLDYIHKMFKAGKDKETVLEAIITLHKPASYWRDRQEQARTPPAS